ncbi:unnamed protein product, partial [Brassica oleracea]
NVKECKAYLRKHGLRLSGTKPVFTERILEHWRWEWGITLSNIIFSYQPYRRHCFVYTEG